LHPSFPSASYSKIVFVCILQPILLFQRVNKYSELKLQLIAINILKPELSNDNKEVQGIIKPLLFFHMKDCIEKDKIKGDTEAHKDQGDFISFLK
jgi:hypothetical protein